MHIELNDMTTGEYLEGISDVLKARGYRGLKEEYLNHPYTANPVIDPDGCINSKYKDAQDTDGWIYLNTTNLHFSKHSMDYPIIELIVDERQLESTNKERVDLSDEKNTINQLLRAPPVKDIVEDYITQDHGYFAVVTDMRRENRKTTKEFKIVTPKGAEISHDLKENENRLIEALSKIEPYTRSRWKDDRFGRAFGGAFITYFYELVTHPEWKPVGRAYIELLFEPSTIEFAGRALAQRGIEFLPTEEGMYVLGGAIALAYGPELLTPNFWKRKYDKYRSRNMDKEDILEILLDE